MEVRNEVAARGVFVPRLGVVDRDGRSPVVRRVADRLSEGQSSGGSGVDDHGCPCSFVDNVVFERFGGGELGRGGGEVLQVGKGELDISIYTERESERVRAPAPCLSCDKPQTAHEPDTGDTHETLGDSAADITTIAVDDAHSQAVRVFVRFPHCPSADLSL